MSQLAHQNTEGMSDDQRFYYRQQPAQNSPSQDSPTIGRVQTRPVAGQGLSSGVPGSPTSSSR